VAGRSPGRRRRDGVWQIVAALRGAGLEGRPLVSSYPTTRKESEMYTIEIYERKTGKVIDTQEIDSLASFGFYWSHQCDKKTYHWRILSKDKKYPALAQKEQCQTQLIS
jgi:hypothetical protein